MYFFRLKKNRREHQRTMVAGQERGNPVFYSYKPELKEIGAECLQYINGEPDFTEYSKFVFPIASMTDDRVSYSEFYMSNFEHAYMKLAEELKMDVSGIKKWLKKEHYTIHESNDLTRKN